MDRGEHAEAAPMPPHLEKPDRVTGGAKILLADGQPGAVEGREKARTGKAVLVNL